MTAPSVSVGARRHLDRLRQAHPEWHAWLDLVAETVDAIADPAWRAVAPHLAPGRPPATPLLVGATVGVPPCLLDAWLRHLLARAGATQAVADPAATSGLTAAAADPHLDAVALLEAAVNQDADALAARAAALDADPDALAAVVHVAATPLLQTCRRHLAAEIPKTWAGGGCPVCAAWPTMAESRGLERARRLRCGRCGADWAFVSFRCPFCFNADHQTLGSLVPEGAGETRKVDTCTLCKGYLKTLTTLTAWAPDEVALADLATVDLDLAALDQGYARPDTLPIDLRLRLVPVEQGAAVPDQNGATRPDR